MELETFRTVLADELGAEKGDEGTWELPAGKRVTLLLRIGEEPMPITKVRRVTFCDDYIKVATEEAHYFVESDHLFGVRLDEPAAEAGEHRAGFFR
jgi:hypothetical protein